MPTKILRPWWNSSNETWANSPAWRDVVRCDGPGSATWQPPRWTALWIASCSTRSGPCRWRRWISTRFPFGCRPWQSRGSSRYRVWKWECWPKSGMRWPPWAARSHKVQRWWDWNGFLPSIRSQMAIKTGKTAGANSPNSTFPLTCLTAWKRWWWLFQ